MMESLKKLIDGKPGLKRWLHWALIPTGDARPRLWVRWLVNPLVHSRGRGSIVRRYVRLDILPFNHFSLGSKSIIEDFSTINNGVGAVSIGNDSIIGLGNTIIGPVTIGNSVMLAQNVVLSGLNHKYEDVTKAIKHQDCSTSEIIVEDEAWIAAGSVVVPGVTIGRHAIVAAGSVVTKNVEPYTLVGGNPARVLKKYDFESKEWIRNKKQIR